MCESIVCGGQVQGTYSVPLRGFFTPSSLGCNLLLLGVWLPVKPPGTSRAPTSSAITLAMPSHQGPTMGCCHEPRSVMNPTGRKGKVKPSMVIVAPICAASTNSLASWRIFAAGTVLMFSAHSGVKSLTDSFTFWKAGTVCTPFTVKVPSKAIFMGSTASNAAAWLFKVSQTRGFLPSVSYT
jgi:hypothetical protein